MQFIPQLHVMKTAKVLNYEPKEAITLVWVTFQALKLKMVKGSGFEIYKVRECQKVHKEETEEITVDNEVEKDTPVSFLVYINRSRHPIYFNVEVCIKLQLVYNSNRLHTQRFSFQQLRRSHFWIQKKSAFRFVWLQWSSYWAQTRTFVWIFSHED